MDVPGPPSQAPIVGLWDLESTFRLATHCAANFKEWRSGKHGQFPRRCVGRIRVTGFSTHRVDFFRPLLFSSPQICYTVCDQSCSLLANRKFQISKALRSSVWRLAHDAAKVKVVPHLHGAPAGGSKIFPDLKTRGSLVGATRRGRPLSWRCRISMGSPEIQTLQASPLCRSSRIRHALRRQFQGAVSMVNFRGDASEIQGD